MESWQRTRKQICCGVVDGGKHEEARTTIGDMGEPQGEHIAGSQQDAGGHIRTGDQ